jgi:protein-tyrosine phosphatase
MGTSSGKELKTVAPYTGDEDNLLADERPGSATNQGDGGGVRCAERVALPAVDKLKSPPLGHSSSGGGFNFQITEGQTRRNLLADCDNECSAVCDFIFVSGAKVASSYETLVKNKISRVVNCAVTVVDNYFINDPRFTYLSLNLLDSRQDDLTWFFCEVINFVEKGRLAGQKTLIHCEKGVSRSCSFAIAYFMWAQGLGWRESFDVVKRGRSICAPNTGFWCNLIELSELLNGNTKETTLLFRCANHLAHDSTTPVLKLCINQDTRKILMPRTSLLDPRGIFVLRCGTNNQNSRLFIWAGSNSSSSALTEAIRLAHFMMGVFSMASGVTIVQQYAETDEFRREIMEDGPFNHRSTAVDNVIFSDLYLADPIAVSRQGTPLTKVRSGTVLPDPSPHNTPRLTPRQFTSDPLAAAQLQTKMQPQPPSQGKPSFRSQRSDSKDVDIFVKVRRGSRESAQNTSVSTNASGTTSASASASASASSGAVNVSMETDRIIATINALTAAKSSSPTESTTDPNNLNSNSFFSATSKDSDARTSPTFNGNGKVSGKRNAEEMEVDSPTQPTPADEDHPSPKHRISNPPSLELSGENFESFRSQSDIHALNTYIDSCRIGGSSLDSHDSNAPAEGSGESKSEFSARLKSLGVALQLPTSQVQAPPQNSLLSIVDKAAEIRHPEKSGTGGASSNGGKYEIWTNANQLASLPNPTATSLAGGKVNDSLEPIKELHPDHVDSPHVVTYREKPMLYLAMPSEDVPDWKEYVWLPMGVYDDEDLQEDALLLLVCPKGAKYLWVGGTFQVPAFADDVPVVKKKVPRGSFDDLSDDDMDVCGTMSGDDKEILKWVRQIDSSTVVCKNKLELFDPECISIQR